MRRFSVLFISLAIISLSTMSSRAQRGIGAETVVLDDTHGNTLTLRYLNSPPIAGNSFFTFAPGGGSSTPGGTANGQTLWWNNTTTSWTVDNSLTNTGAAIGIGTPSPGSPLDVEHTFTQTTTQVGVNALIIINPSAPSTVRYDAIQGLADIEGSNQITGNYVEGVHGQTTVGQFSAVTQPASYIVGTVGQSSNYSTQTITEADGIYGEVDNLTTGTITTANAVTALMANTGGGTITNASGLHILSPENTATITNLYGIYINPQTTGTNNWPIFLSDGSASGSIFNIDKSGNTTAASLSVMSGNISSPTSGVGAGTDLSLKAGGSGGANAGAGAFLAGGNGNGTGNGGQSSVNGGNGTNGGNTFLHGGAGSSAGTGGSANVWAGNGGSGGVAEVVAGSATSSNNYGGNTNIQAGTGFGNGFGGSVVLTAGPGGTTGAGGGIYFQTSSNNNPSVTVMGITNTGTLQVGSANQFQVDNSGNTSTSGSLSTSSSFGMHYRQDNTGNTTVVWNSNDGVVNITGAGTTGFGIGGALVTGQIVIVINNTAAAFTTGVQNLPIGASSMWVYTGAAWNHIAPQ